MITLLTKLKKHFFTIALIFAPVAVAANPVVNGNTISWPDDGWYQVQSAVDFDSICEGTSFCQVAAGRYLVVNHTTGERFENIVVENTSNPITRVTVQGNTISWPDDGWYQVQSALDYSEQCAGTSNCTVESGTYIVINHTTGARENVVIGSVEQQNDSEVSAQETLIDPESDFGQLQIRVISLAGKVLRELNRSLNQGMPLRSQETQCMGAYDQALGEPLLAIDCEQPLSVDSVPIYLKSASVGDSPACRSSLHNSNANECRVVQAELLVNTLWYVAPTSPGQPQRPQPKAGTQIQYNTEQNLLSFKNLPAALSGFFNCEYDLITGNAVNTGAAPNCDRQIVRIIELIDAHVANRHI